MGSRRRYQKRKAAGDSAVAPALKRKKPIVSDSDSDEAKIQKLEKAGALEEGKILKLKKEFVAANQASVSKIPLFLTEPTPEEETAAAAALLQPGGDGMKKRKTKKVLIKRVVPRCVMESYKARLFTIIPDECILTDDDLAKHSQDFQKSYAENMDLMNKMRAWQKALLEQYDRFGYAVDKSEAEVTDDDDDDEEDPAAEVSCEMQTPPTCPIQCTVDSPKVHTEHSYPSGFEPVDPTVDAGPPNSSSVDTHPTEDNDDFIEKVARKNDCPLICEPQKQPAASAKPLMPRRSRRLATQSLSRVPVSKRGEVLIMQRMDYTTGSSALSASEMEAFDRLFDGNLTACEAEVMDELDPTVRKGSSNQPQRLATS